MSERGVSRTQAYVYAILGVSALTLLSALGWGVATGALSADGAAQAGSTGSEGTPTALLGTSEGSFGAGADGGNGGGRDGILVLSNGGTRLRSASVPGGAVEAEITLPGRAREIVATPGGVSVWVTFEDRPTIEVYSTTDLEHEATIDPPVPEGGAGDTADGGAGDGGVAPQGGRSGAPDSDAPDSGARGDRSERLGVPEHLTFSETGETLFVTWTKSTTISVYRHEMRELTPRGEIDAEGTEGPVLRNRRATRLFRRDRNGGLAVFFAQNGQRMGTVAGTRLAEVPALTFSADYTEAWGSTSGGKVVGIGEATSTAVVASNKVSPGHAPVVPERAGSAVFVDEAERGILALDISGVEIPEAGGDQGESSGAETGGDTATARDETTSPGVEIGSLPQTGSLRLSEIDGISGRQVASLAHTDNGAVVVVTTRGELVTVDPSSFEIVSVSEVGGDEDDLGGAAAGGAGVDDGVDGGANAGAAGAANGNDADGPSDGAGAGEVIPERVVAWSVKEDGNFACF